MKCKSSSRDGFTLLELAVVIAMLAVMASLLLPALAGSRLGSKSMQCMNNMKQLATAWTMYADANSERIVNLNTFNRSATLAANVPWRTQISWESINVPAGLAPGSAAAQIYLTEMGYKQPMNNTGPANIVNGPLYAYAPFVDVIHCPADFRANLPASQNGSAYKGPFSWDSYGGTTFLNGERGGFTKRTQVLHPSGRIAWAEAAPARGEIIGSWSMSGYGTVAHSYIDAAFGDSPAAFHNAAANFNFCDGHVEIHKWQDSKTIAYANDININKDSGNPSHIAATQPGNVDATWVAMHYATAQNP